MQKLAKNSVLGNLKQLQYGQLTLCDGSQQWVFGTPGGCVATVNIVNNAFYTNYYCEVHWVWLNLI